MKEGENIYLPSSRKKGGETIESIKAYFEAFPLRPESESVDYENYLGAKNTLMRIQDQIFDAMSWIKIGTIFIDTIQKKKLKNPGFKIDEEEKNHLLEMVTKKIVQK